jgi:hypothetical protein
MPPAREGAVPRSIAMSSGIAIGKTTSGAVTGAGTWRVHHMTPAPDTAPSSVPAASAIQWNRVFALSALLVDRAAATSVAEAAARQLASGSEGWRREWESWRAFSRSPTFSGVSRSTRATATI